MSDGAGKLPTNPYIGARPFRRNERIYGRAREARDLLSMLVGDRIVLLNSPSGAGKTSLIQAALVPALERRRFAVRPTIRVGAPAPLPAANRYLLSVMQSLEDARPPAAQLPPQQLAALRLDKYLRQRAGDDAQNGQVLIFDQFEEVLTLDPADEPARLAFFTQLGDALADPWRWALFAIREEYVAALEPYLHLVPTRFANTFRLDLLGVEAAAAAIRGPAQGRGVTFDDCVAEELARDLAKVVAQDATSQLVERVGVSVEPVQLQVVCFRLWERRFPEPADPQGQTISAADVQAIGSIDTALEAYYASGVAQAAAVGGVGERAVRAWVDTQLITRQGFRSQVLAGNEAAFGLSETTVDGLTDAYLVREERRRGVRWLELAHDRLIAPARASNARWFAANLSPLQRQAEVWAAQSQPASLLFRDADLVTAEAWATANAAALTADERLFLENCREERQRAEERARAARRIRNLAIGASVAAVLALIAFVAALGFFNQANQQRGIAVANQHQAQTQEANAVAQRATAESSARVSRARELAAASLNQITIDPERAVLLGIEAVAVTMPDDPAVPDAIDTLQQAANASRLIETVQLPSSAISLAYSADGQYLAASTGTNQAAIWKAGPPLSQAATISATAVIYTIAFDPGRPVIATGGEANTLELWDRESGAALAASLPLDDLIAQVVYSPDGSRIAVLNYGSRPLLLLDPLTLEPQAEIDDPDLAMVAFSPDSRLIAGTGSGDQLKLWDAQSGQLVRALSQPTGMYALAFSPDGRWLAAGGTGTELFVWDLSAAPQPGEPADTPPALQLHGHAGTIFSVAFSPDGHWLVSGGADGAARIWDIGLQKLVASLPGTQGGISQLAVQPGSNDDILASVGSDSALRVWQLGLLHSTDVNGLAFIGADRLVAGDERGDAIVWDLTNNAALLRLPRQPNAIYRVAVSQRGDRFATVTKKGLVQIWDAATGSPLGPPLEQPAGLGSVAFSPDGAQIATASNYPEVNLWDVASGASLGVVGKHDAERLVRAVAYSPDGKLVASGDDQGSIHIWDVASRSDAVPALTFADGTQVNALMFSPDGHYLAVAGKDTTPWVYDLREPANPRPLSGHTGDVSQIAFSPDSARLATIGRDFTARIWDASSGALIIAYTLPRVATPYSLAFSPDSSRIAVGGKDGVVRIIPLGTDDLLAFARSRVSRGELTGDECETYLHQQAGCAP